MGVGEAIAAAFGFCILAVGIAAFGQWLREGLDRLFGAQMRHQFPAPPDDPSTRSGQAR